MFGGGVPKLEADADQLVGVVPQAVADGAAGWVAACLYTRSVSKVANLGVSRVTVQELTVVPLLDTVDVLLASHTSCVVVELGFLADQLAGATPFPKLLAAFVGAAGWLAASR